MHQDTEKQVVPVNNGIKLESLPVELLIHIMSKLSIGGLATVRCLNHYFKNLSSTQSIWRNLLQHRLQINQDDIPNHVLSSMQHMREFYLEKSICLVNTDNGELAFRLRNAIKEKLTDMYFDNIELNNFTPRQWQAICEILRNFTKVQRINYPHISLHNFLLAKQPNFILLLNNPKLKTINFSSLFLNSLNMPEWKSFCSALKSASSLQELIINSNYLGDLPGCYWQSFGEYLKNSNIKSICFRKNGFFTANNSQWQALLCALAEARMLKSLDLSENNFQHNYHKLEPFITQSYQINNALTVKFSLEKLYLAANKLGDDGIFKLAAHLTTNKTLTAIDLSNNNISDKGANALATALSANVTIKSVDISNNNIADAGAAALATTLLTNSTIENICLDDNNIRNQGSHSLFHCLCTNFSLITLGIHKNPIYDISSNYIFRLLKRNKIIKLYPRHIDLICAMFADKKWHRITYTPLALRTICGIFILENTKQKSIGEIDYIRQLEMLPLNESSHLLLKEVQALSDTAWNKTFRKKLPNYGCNFLPTLPQTNCFKSERSIHKTQKPWLRGVIAFLQKNRPNKFRNKIEKNMYQILQQAKLILERESFKPIPSDSIYCCTLRNQNFALAHIKRLNKKYAFYKGTSPTIPYLINQSQAISRINLFYQRGNLIRVSLASLCRYIIKKNLIAKIKTGKIKLSPENINSHLINLKFDEAMIIQMLDNRIQNFHSQQLTNIRISDFSLTKRNKHWFMQQLCGNGMKLHQFNDGMTYYTSPSMSKNHMKTFIGAVEAAFTAINFKFKGSSLEPVPGSKNKEHTIAYIVNSCVNPNYQRAYISEWLVDQLAAQQQQISVYSDYTLVREEMTDDIYPDSTHQFTKS